MYYKSYLAILVGFLYSQKSGKCLAESVNGNGFPPLYELEPWSHCQQPGDVYCLVDAALHSYGDNDTSHLIDHLKDYSAVVLKHYNRTVVHRGVCVSRCSNVTSTVDQDVWPPALRECVSDSLMQYGLQAEILSMGYCSVAQNDPPMNPSERGFLITSLVLIGVALFATAFQVMGEKCTKWEGNKYLLAFSLKNNWQILTSVRANNNDRISNITSIEGIRFMAMLCVIMSHVLFVYIYSYTDNPEYIENMYEETGWRIMFNSPLWVQAFFSLSGFLTAYFILIYCEKHAYTWTKLLLAVLARWIRLTPTALFALWFTMSWFPRLGSGPQWGWLVQREADDCQHRWWSHALYLHNHLPLGKFCMGHTWYLAVDMQLHVATLVLLWLLGNRAVWVAVLGVVGSMFANGLVAYFYSLTPVITAQAPESLRQLFVGNEVLKLLYLPSYMNIVGYACGIITAFILYHLQQNGGKLNENKVFTSLFHLSLVAGSIVVTVGTIFLRQTTPGVASAIYSALDKTLVSICFNVFLLGCFTQCKSHLRTFLEGRVVHVLGRLSYCVFLLHFIVLRVMIASNTQLAHMSILSCISLLITTATITYAVSVPVCLLVELPFLQLWKAVVSPPAAPELTTGDAAPAPEHKPFDLVSQLRRNRTDAV